MNRRTFFAGLFAAAASAIGRKECLTFANGPTIFKTTERLEAVMIGPNGKITPLPKCRYRTYDFKINRVTGIVEFGDPVIHYGIGR